MAGATQADPNRTFPDGIDAQYIEVRLNGWTKRGEGVGSLSLVEEVVVLVLDATATAYGSAGIENGVVDALNRLQAALARERGEDGF